MRASRFRAIQVSDFYEIEPHAGLTEVMPCMLAKPLVLQQVADNPFAFAMEVDGKVVALAGITDLGEVWAILSATIRPSMLRLTRYTQAMLRIGGRPVKAHVQRADPAAVRWALLLGFRKVKIDPQFGLDTWIYQCE
ncbi:MAG: hypothetical protein AB7U76_24490 [Pirellulales bacterium]